MHTQKDFAILGCEYVNPLEVPTVGLNVLCVYGDEQDRESKGKVI